MQAVFLDKGTFSEGIDLPAPIGVSDYITYNDTPKDTAVIIDRCKDADIIITNKVQIGAEMIEQLPKLKLIQLTATGMNTSIKPLAISTVLRCSMSLVMRSKACLNTHLCLC